MRAVVTERGTSGRLARSSDRLPGPARHDEDDPLLGQPLCGDCYDYASHVVWQWWAPGLWRRFSIAPYRHDYYGTRIFSEAVRAAGLPPSTTSHDLRHHYASVLLAQGESVIAVAERLGHHNAGLVLSTYGHLMRTRRIGPAARSTMPGRRVPHPCPTERRRARDLRGWGSFRR